MIGIRRPREPRTFEPRRWAFPLGLVVVFASAAACVATPASSPDPSPEGTEPSPRPTGPSSASPSPASTASPDRATDPASPAPPAASGGTPVRVTVGDQVFSAELYDNPTARNLADQLPVTVTVDDLHGLEKTGPLPRALTTDGMPRRLRPRDRRDRLLRPRPRPRPLLRRRRLLHRHHPDRPLRRTPSTPSPTNPTASPSPSSGTEMHPDDHRPTSPDSSVGQRSAGGSLVDVTKADRPRRDRLPLPALLVFALLGFLLISTETMPAGILPQIANGMHTSLGIAGQLVSAYALGTVLVTIPAIVLTRRFRRKPLFLVGIAAFLLANTAVAVSPHIAFSLTARFVAGGPVRDAVGDAGRLHGQDHPARTGGPCPVAGCRRGAGRYPPSAPRWGPGSVSRSAGGGRSAASPSSPSPSWPWPSSSCPTSPVNSKPPGCPWAGSSDPRGCPDPVRDLRLDGRQHHHLHLHRTIPERGRSRGRHRDNPCGLRHRLHRRDRPDRGAHRPPPPGAAGRLPHRLHHRRRHPDRRPPGQPSRSTPRSPCGA